MTTNATTAISSATNYLSKINDLSTFPTPGVDNDSQGFRDQWANIHGAIKAVNDGVKDLNINTIKTNETTSFYGNTIKDVNLENSSVTLVDLELQAGDITIDYAAGGYQTMAVTAGEHGLSVVNWPSAASGNSGKLTLVFTLSDTASEASINFMNNKFQSLDAISTASGVVYNIHPGSNMMFELWSEEAVSNNRDPRYFVKQIGYNTSTSTNWSTIGSNGSITFIASTGTSKEIVVTNGSLAESIALVPNVVSKIYKNPPEVGVTQFEVDSINGIYSGASIYFNSTSTKYTVSYCTSTVINSILKSFVVPTTTIPDSIYISMASNVDSITFVNPTFTGQKVALNLTSTLPTSTTSSTRELKGQVYADTSTAFIIFADANAGLINKVQISGDNSGNPRALGASTATTQPVGTTSTLVATTEFVWKSLTDSGTLVAKATTASYATTATYAVNAIYATTASSMVSGTNGFGTRTVSYSAPTGGVDGDIWYQII